MRKSLKSTLAQTAILGTLALGGMATARAEFLPIVHPYESFNDSPFKSLAFSSFTLVDMTLLPSNTSFNGLVAGVTTDVNAVVLGPGPQIDSVDGLGNNGHSLFWVDGAEGITFSFDAAVLGSLPTAAGIVWTDGLVPITFSANDQNGVSLGQITDSVPGDFNNGDGNPGHFRFYGVENPGGISSIHIANPGGGGIEVDHLQFGNLSDSATPEPNSGLLAAAILPVLCGIVLFKRNRRTLRG